MMITNLSLTIQTMSSREISQLCSKEHRNVMADIRKMLESLDLTTAEFSAVYKADNGQEYECFNLPKRETLILVSGYDVVTRAKIIDRWTELENQQQQKEQRYFNPLEKIGDITEQCLKIAHLHGFEGNQALISADKAVKTLTGYSPMQLIGATHLVAEVQAQMLNATELGRQLSPQLSAVKTNLILAGLGLQVKVEGKWEATEAGKPYSIYLDTSKKHSDGTPVKQLKWYTTVLPLLK